MPEFEVITRCPYHDKPVFINVVASDPEAAKNIVLGMDVVCPWGRHTVSERVVKVKVLKSFTENVLSFREGDVLTVSVADGERWKEQGLVEWLGAPFVSEVKAPDTFKVVYVEGVRMPSAPLAAETKIIEGKRGVPTSFVEAPILEEAKPFASEGVYALSGPLARRLEEKPDWFRGDVLESERVRLVREWQDSILVAKLKILAERLEKARDRYKALISMGLKDEAEKYRTETLKDVKEELEMHMEKFAGPMDTIWFMPKNVLEEYKRLTSLLEGFS
jgi:hypothetical protein